MVNNCKIKQVIGAPEKVEVKHLFLDSRRVTPGSLFFAVPGVLTDGHQYIETAIEKGAVAIVCEQLPSTILQHITYIQVEHSASQVGVMAANFYDQPSEKLKVVAITGTNGKTTCATLLYELFRSLGYKVGLLSTIENRIDTQILDAQLTTPDALSLQKLMAQMVEQGCTHCFMEASSHAIVQERLAGIALKGAVFTNITHDHLDYHQTFKNYIYAKKQLFDKLGKEAFALVNFDDKRGQVMQQNTKARKLGFSLKSMADFKGKLKANSFEGLQMEINGRESWFRLIGDFNAYNLLAVYASAVLLGEKEEQVLTALSGLTPARGRFDQIVSKDNRRFIIDYAHTPDALENVLKTIQSIRQSKEERIITLVGCGGNRDKEKRPKMAKIAAEYSDLVVLTSDNPRDEEPETILEDMKKGLQSEELTKSVSISDRKDAIRYAMEQAQGGDIVLVAGKGHETYQEIKGTKYTFDDKQVIRDLLA
ncbi:UDP-N-acetylmuramoyl-L-alanyl-D-glutamate--2,6-diaminopimelate ligase [Rapidithrix thailandica]|uniref:UDP-N-acetylmuramoyl-L-alanyl-D-glutamate--2,6-diaminopimelate ligase n=1 Tax=Rapidithrix thailandica TaxID=413964 RepID=A0AAW9S124_9BACT